MSKMVYVVFRTKDQTLQKVCLYRGLSHAVFSVYCCTISPPAVTSTTKMSDCSTRVTLHIVTDCSTRLTLDIVTGTTSGIYQVRSLQPPLQMNLSSNFSSFEPCLVNVEAYRPNSLEVTKHAPRFYN